MLGSFNNWNIITFSHKVTTGEAFEEIHQVFLDGIRKNTALFVQYGNYSYMNTTYTTTMGYYVVKFISEAHTLQEYTTCDGKINTSGELVVKVQYLN